MADDTDELAAVDGEAHVLEHRRRSRLVPLAKAVHLKERGRGSKSAIFG
jgi:hypothetical protein